MLFASQSEKRTQKRRCSRRQKARRRNSTTRRIQLVESLEDRRLLAVAGGFASHFDMNLNQDSWFGTDQVQQGRVQANFFGLRLGSAIENIDNDAPGLKVQPPLQENPAQPGGGDDDEEQKPNAGDDKPADADGPVQPETLEQVEQQQVEIQEKLEKLAEQISETIADDRLLTEQEKDAVRNKVDQVHQLRGQLEVLGEKINALKNPVDVPAQEADNGKEKEQQQEDGLVDSGTDTTDGHSLTKKVGDEGTVTITSSQPISEALEKIHDETTKGFIEQLLNSGDDATDSQPASEGVTLQVKITFSITDPDGGEPIRIVIDIRATGKPSDLLEKILSVVEESQQEQIRTLLTTLLNLDRIADSGQPVHEGLLNFLRLRCNEMICTGDDVSLEIEEIFVGPLTPQTASDNPAPKQEPADSTGAKDSKNAEEQGKEGKTSREQSKGKKSSQSKEKSQKTFVPFGGLKTKMGLGQAAGRFFKTSSKGESWWDQSPAHPGGGEGDDEQKPKVENEKPAEETLEQLQQQREENYQQQRNMLKRQMELRGPDFKYRLKPSDRAEYRNLERELVQLDKELTELDEKIAAAGDQPGSLEQLEQQKESIEQQIEEKRKEKGDLDISDDAGWDEYERLESELVLLWMDLFDVSDRIDGIKSREAESGQDGEEDPADPATPQGDAIAQEDDDPPAEQNDDPPAEQNNDQDEQPETLEQLEKRRAELQQQHEQNEAKQRELDQDGEIDASEEAQWNELQEENQRLQDQLGVVDEEILVQLIKQRAELQRQHQECERKQHELGQNDPMNVDQEREFNSLQDKKHRLQDQLRELDNKILDELLKRRAELQQRQFTARGWRLLLVEDQLRSLDKRIRGMTSQNAVNGRNDDEMDAAERAELIKELNEALREAQRKLNEEWPIWQKPYYPSDKVWIENLWIDKKEEKEEQQDNPSNGQDQADAPQEKSQQDDAEENSDTDTSEDSPKPDDADPENSKQGSLQGPDKLASQSGSRFVIVEPGQPLQLGPAENEKFEASRDVEYTDQGATCHDYVDGVINRKADPDEDKVVPSDYKIRYDCPDLPGNQSQPERPPVIVEDRSQSLVDPTDADKMFSEAGFPYTDAGAQAMDSLDGERTDPSGRGVIQPGPDCEHGPNCEPDPRFSTDPDNYSWTYATDYPVEDHFSGLKNLLLLGPYFYNGNHSGLKKLENWVDSQNAGDQDNQEPGQVFDADKFFEEYAPNTAPDMGAEGSFPEDSSFDPFGGNLVK